MQQTSNNEIEKFKGINLVEPTLYFYVFSLFMGNKLLNNSEKKYYYNFVR